ncbi:MAG: cupredoxin family copper-binding protein [Methanoregula sp.]
MVIQSRLLFWSACAVLLILSCACTGCTSSQTPAATPAATTPYPATGSTSILIKNFAFSPDMLTIRSGTTVTWTNQDSAPHQIASDTGSSVSFSSDPLSNGASYQFTFTAPGTYSYHCSIHPTMKGTIVVQS